MWTMSLDRGGEGEVDCEARHVTAASVAVRRVCRLLRSIGCSLPALLALFVGHVVADRASTDRTEDSMMPGVMASDAAHHGAL
jgi:hypothetical protein